jgi:peroxiredoxin
MADETFDGLLRRLEVRAAPDPAYADQLFERLVDEAGFRRGRAGRRARARWLAVPPATARHLAWVALLAALLLALVGLAALRPGGRPLPGIPPTPAADRREPLPTTHLGSSLLSIGSVAPAWTGTLLDGGAFSTADLSGRPAAVLLWCTCIRGPELRLFVEAAQDRGDVAFVFVSMDGAGTTRGIVDDLSIDIPVVVDPEMALLTAWQLEGFPALVLLRADGTVADIQAVTYSEAKLSALLDALRANGQMPDPETRTPGPTNSLGREAVSAVLEDGALAPDLTGPGLDGAEVSTRDLLGKPGVVLFWLPPRADGTTQDDTPPPDAFLDEIESRGAALRLLLVVESEVAPGDARRYLDAHPSDADVMLDRTGELFATWGLVFTQSAVVIDSEGRVLRVAGPEALTDPAALLEVLD